MKRSATKSSKPKDTRGQRQFYAEAEYRAAVSRFPRDAALFQGLGNCAGNAGLHEEAVTANQRALELEQDNQKLVNDLGWTLFQAGLVMRARETLERAVAMGPSDGLARENLRFCAQEISRRKLGKVGNT